MADALTLNLTSDLILDNYALIIKKYMLFVSLWMFFFLI